MAKVLREDCGCDRVQVEAFKENPGSFFGWIYFTITAALLAIACYFFFPLASIILLLGGLFICFMQFGLYKKLVDPVFPEKTGHNVTAVKSCKGEVKRRIFSTAIRMPHGNGRSTIGWVVLDLKDTQSFVFLD